MSDEYWPVALIGQEWCVACVCGTQLGVSLESVLRDTQNLIDIHKQVNKTGTHGPAYPQTGTLMFHPHATCPKCAEATDAQLNELVTWDLAHRHKYDSVSQMWERFLREYEVRKRG